MRTKLADAHVGVAQDVSGNKAGPTEKALQGPEQSKLVEETFGVPLVDEKWVGIQSLKVKESRDSCKVRRLRIHNRNRRDIVPVPDFTKSAVRLPNWEDRCGAPDVVLESDFADPQLTHDQFRVLGPISPMN